MATQPAHPSLLGSTEPHPFWAAKFQGGRLFQPDSDSTDGVGPSRRLQEVLRASARHPKPYCVVGVLAQACSSIDACQFVNQMHQRTLADRSSLGVDTKPLATEPLDGSVSYAYCDATNVLYLLVPSPDQLIGPACLQLSDGDPWARSLFERVDFLQLRTLALYLQCCHLIVLIAPPTQPAHGPGQALDLQTARLLNAARSLAGLGLDRGRPLQGKDSGKVRQGEEGPGVAVLRP